MRVPEVYGEGAAHAGYAPMGCRARREPLLETEVFQKRGVARFEAREQTCHTRGVTWSWPPRLQLCGAVSGGLELVSH